MAMVVCTVLAWSALVFGVVAACSGPPSTTVGAERERPTSEVVEAWRRSLPGR
jgi:hypothetical protein